MSQKTSGLFINIRQQSIQTFPEQSRYKSNNKRSQERGIFNVRIIHSLNKAKQERNGNKFLTQHSKPVSVSELWNLSKHK